MFTFDTAVDAFQGSKKEAVKTFVQNEKIAEALNSFVDAQTAYTKAAIKAGANTATTLVSEFTKIAQEAGKFDYSKFGEGIMKAYTAQTKK
jgi:hypothetical protein